MKPNASDRATLRFETRERCDPNPTTSATSINHRGFADPLSQTPPHAPLRPPEVFSPSFRPPRPQEKEGNISLRSSRSNPPQSLPSVANGGRRRRPSGGGGPASSESEDDVGGLQRPPRHQRRRPSRLCPALPRGVRAFSWILVLRFLGRLKTLR